ncbi:MAG: hypothetical protein QOD06_3167 [Candidatus Binatota bacterium]|jgi:hypothetical protein|nr:hypothetical protein [Candidatus Binatota bacterium]
MSAEVVLGTFSGLRFVDPNLPLGTLVPTMLVVHGLDAIMCRLVAHNQRLPKNLCTAVGFVFGLWAVAALLFWTRRGAAA